MKHSYANESFVDLAYELVLRREADAPAKRAAVAALEAHQLERSDILRNLLASREFEELALVEQLVSSNRDGPFDSVEPVGPGMSERVIEIPWVLSRCRGARSVLDIGYSHAPAVYISVLATMGIEALCGVDIVPRPVPGFHGVGADVRALPFPRGCFDLLLCVSTLEHIGKDNTRYGDVPHDEGQGDRAALEDMLRVLRPGGRLLVTVPFGLAEDHGWFRQYDATGWDALLAGLPASTSHESAYKLTGVGWNRCPSRGDLALCRYGEGAPGATSLLCVELTRWEYEGAA